MTEIAATLWFGRWGTSVFSRNTAIFVSNYRRRAREVLVNRLEGLCQTTSSLHLGEHAFNSIPGMHCIPGNWPIETFSDMQILRLYSNWYSRIISSSNLQCGWVWREAEVVPPLHPRRINVRVKLALELGIWLANNFWGKYIPHDSLGWS